MKTSFLHTHLGTAVMGVVPSSAALAHVALITTTPPTGPPVSAPAVAEPAIPSPPISASLLTPLSSPGPSILPGTSLFLGEGICPLPEHLRKKILNLEYVDMAELRPESWLMSADVEASGTLSSLFRRRKQPVTDVAVWVQCYSSLVSVLVEKFPQYIKHFLAYQATIMMGAKQTRGLSWVAYDAAYRRKAACTKSLFWGTVDQYLYTVWFTNQASNPACIVCFSADHTTENCPNNTAIPVLGQAVPQPPPQQSNPTASTANYGQHSTLCP